MTENRPTFTGTVKLAESPNVSVDDDGNDTSTTHAVILDSNGEEVDSFGGPVSEEWDEGAWDQALADAGYRRTGNWDVSEGTAPIVERRVAGNARVASRGRVTTGCAGTPRVTHPPKGGSRMGRRSWRFWDHLAGVGFVCFILGCLGVLGGVFATWEVGRVTGVFGWAMGGSAAFSLLGVFVSVYADRKADAHLLSPRRDGEQDRDGLDEEEAD